MNMTEQIDFRQTRDFSQVLTETFNFVRQNIKILGTHLVIVMGFPAVLVGFLTEYWTPNATDFQTSGFDFLDYYAALLPLYLITMLLSIFYSCLIYAYTMLYIERGFDQFETRDVFNYASRYLLKATIASLLSFVFLMVAVVMFILPFFYILVPLSFLYIVIFNEDKGIFESISRCFEVVSGNWWNTFGLIILLGVIVYMLTIAVSVPQILMGVFIEFNAAKNEDIEMYKLISAFLGVFTNLAGYLIFLIFHFGIIFQYFSLVEQKEVPGLLRRIDSIAQSEEPDGESPPAAIDSNASPGDKE